jgi:hypothetical protein
MPQSNSKPTRPQLRCLRELAEQTGTASHRPRPRQQGSAEIERLKQRPALCASNDKPTAAG